MGSHLGDLLDQLGHVSDELGVLRLCHSDHRHAVARRQGGLDESLRRFLDRLQGERVHVQIVEAEGHEAGPKFALRFRRRCRDDGRLRAATGVHVRCEMLLREGRDRLPDPGVVDFEVVLGETGNRAVLPIADHHRDLHHVHLGAQSDRRWRHVGNGPRMHLVGSDGLSRRQAETG